MISSSTYSKRRLGGDRGAVSEVLGDIMLVLMSVIMLSVLALQLMSIPPPSGMMNVDTVATFDGTNLTIQHVGGSELKDPDVSIQVGKEGTSPSLYDVGSGHAGGRLGVGELWMRDISGVVAPDDKVRVAIIDSKNDRLLSEQIIERQKDYGNLPDIGLTSADIAFWRAGSLIDDGANAPMQGDTITINITVHNFGRVPVDNLSVATSVFMYSSTSLPQRGIFHLNASGQPEDNVTLSVPWPVTAWGPHTIYVRVIPLKNESLFTNNYANKQVRVGPGILIPDAPDLNITALYVSNSHPQHGDAVKFFVRIANQGGVPASVSLTYRDTGVALYTDYNISVSSGQVLEVSTVWIPMMGGIHTLRANVSVTSLPDDPNYANNDRTLVLEVLPTIVLVDDDRSGDGGLKDVTTPLRGALSAAGAKYTLYNVGGGDGPKYDTGPSRRRLMDFDLVIWACGYEFSSTLTSNDMLELARYLDAGGKLWLIGQDIIDDIKNTNATFLTDRLHVTGHVLGWGTPNPLGGVAGNTVTEDHSHPVNVLPWTGGLSDRGDAIVPDGASIGAFRDNGTNVKNSVMFNETTNGSGPAPTLAFFAFEFSQLRSANDRAAITYDMLRWFGALAQYGRDLALSEQLVSNLNPDFMDEVNITVFLRNNGGDDEPVGGDRVNVLYIINGVPIPPYEVYIDDVLQNSTLTTNPVEVPLIGAHGGVVKISMKWVANRVGTHSIRVMVDPFNFIAEVDEDNNEVWGASGAQLSVRYSVLVVDDDDSPNNRAMATNYNSTDDLMKAFQRLGYTGASYIVPGPSQNGPNETLLRRYNTVIWLTGQCAPGAPNPLTALDQASLAGFLSAGDERGLWLIGQDMFPSGTYAAGTFVHDFLHVTDITMDQGVPDPLLGVKYDPVGHGINYTIARTFNPATGGTVIVPRADARGVTYRDPSASTYNTVRYHSSSMAYKVVYQGWDLSFIGDRGAVPEEECEAEFTYAVLHWFGMPERRIELRVTEVDLYYGNMTPAAGMAPTMGNSYVFKAVVHNLGGSRGDCSVRFTDGSTVIGTAFVSVGASGSTMAEIIWTPLYAGLRPIFVTLDPDQVVPEIFKFNDRAGLDLRTYFFFDDMEGGTRNWRHEATIVRLNGESALEYIDIGNVSTGIASSWQELNGFSRTVSDYHSMNSSFHMREPGPPLDLALVFDTSNSMMGQPLLDEKNAAKALVDQLTNDSRVAVFRMGANAGVRFQRPLTLLDAAGRTAVKSTIDALDCQAWTQIWRTVGEAIEYVLAAHSPERLPAVVALCDGQDYQGSDSTIGDPPNIPADYNNVEKGSNPPPDPGFCPWYDWGTDQTVGSHWGKYFGKAGVQGYWFRQTYGGPGNHARGLLNAPLPIYTIGIKLEHDSDLPAFATIATVNNYDRGGSVYTGAGSQESGTPEYNLYRISSTSVKGKYFYAPSAADLYGIFDQVAEELSSLSLTRGARSAGAPGSDDGARSAGAEAGGEGGASARSPNIPGANDRYALTTSFSLQGVSTAKLSFWHKYQITMGWSGAVVLVGTSADNITFTYKYVTPGQSYKGNIRTDITRTDDLGNEIRWCWNGVSGGGAYGWEYVEVNLNQFCSQQHVRIMFAYIRAGGGGGKGWYMDDVEVKVSRSNSVLVSPSSSDQWDLVKKGDTLGAGGDVADARSGQYAWLCHNPDAGVDYLKGGLDNCLITAPIDLSNALDATLIAAFKFNINFTEGRPPDGFRVEVSSDTGVTWRPVHFGVRAAWKVSGTEAAGGDGKSFTGVDVGGNWVMSTSLARLNCELTGWAGSVIQIRFRVVTRTDLATHYHSAAAGFGGFYIDDVTVFGNTTTGYGRGARETEQGAGHGGQGRPAARPPVPPPPAIAHPAPSIPVPAPGLPPSARTCILPSATREMPPWTGTRFREGGDGA